MISRLTSDARMPSWPIEMPSDTAMVVNSIGNPPAARTPSFDRLASRSSGMLQGVTSFHDDATATWGLSQSSSVMPIARSIARAGARSGPSVTSRLRGLMSTGVSPSSRPWPAGYRGGSPIPMRSPRADTPLYCVARHQAVFLHGRMCGRPARDGRCTRRSPRAEVDAPRAARRLRRNDSDRLNTPASLRQGCRDAARRDESDAGRQRRTWTEASAAWSSQSELDAHAAHSVSSKAQRAPTVRMRSPPERSAVELDGVEGELDRVTRESPSSLPGARSMPASLLCCHDGGDDRLGLDPHSGMETRLPRRARAHVAARPR